MVDDWPLSFPARVELHRRKMAEAQAAGDLPRVAQHQAHLCIYEAFTSGPPDTCARAEQLAKSLGRRDLQALAVIRHGGVLAWRLAFVEARAECLRALALAGDRPRSLAVRGSFLLLGGLAIELGRYDEADLHLRLALALSQAAGDAEMISFSQQYLARNATFLGDYPEAVRLARAALDAALGLGDLNTETFSYWLLGEALEGGGRLEEARAVDERGAARSVTLGSPIHQVLFANRLADVNLRLGRVGDARRSLDRSRALVASGQISAGWNRVIDNYEGHVYAAEGRDREAAQAFERVRGYATSGWSMSTPLTNQGRALRRLGELEGARAAYQEAIAAIESSRPQTAESRRTSFASKYSGVYRELVSLLWQMHGASAAGEALGVAEAGRARALLDGLQAAGVEGRPHPRGAAEIQARLAPDEMLIEFVSLENQLLAFAVTAGELRAVELSGGQAELAARVAYFRQLVQEADDAATLVPAGAALYRDLLAPLLDGRAVRRLIVAPDGPLRELPFDALVAGGAFLSERVTLVSTPSASILAAAEAGGRGAGLIAVAAPPPRAGMPPLPSSLAEAQAAVARVDGARLFSGAQATERRLRDGGLGAAAILHFATHAVVVDDAPERSALLLAPGDGDDGFLRAGEIYPLRLAADLVVLSACRSAVGRGAGGEGLLSLERAFLFAGARSVVSTLWEVGDASSLALMERFYQALARGAPVSDALAAAKRSLLAAGGPPRAWAGFVLVGSPDTRVAGLRPASRRVAWPTIGAAVLLLASATAWWRGRPRRRAS